MAHRNLPQKAILLLDNAPSHPPADQLISEDGSIFVIYMPPNVTPLIQPMDQNIIRITKLNYRTCLLNSILASTTNENVISAIKKISLKGVVLNLFAAWNKIDQAIIWKCWTNILNDSEFEDQDDIPLSALRQNMREDINVPAEELVSLLNNMDSNVRNKFLLRYCNLNKLLITTGI